VVIMLMSDGDALNPTNITQLDLIDVPLAEEKGRRRLIKRCHGDGWRGNSP